MRKKAKWKKTKQDNIDLLNQVNIRSQFIKEMKI